MTASDDDIRVFLQEWTMNLPVGMLKNIITVDCIVEEHSMYDLW